MDIKNISSVLAGIDRVSEKATTTFRQIPKDALRDAGVVDLSASDMAERLASKKAATAEAPAPTENKRPTLG